MRVPKTVYDHIFENNFKTGLLILLFPAVLCTLIYGFTFLFFMSDPMMLKSAMAYLSRLVPIMFGCALGWMFFSWAFGDKMMLGFADAKDISYSLDPAHLRIRRTVENVALAAGLPTPRVYLVQDTSMNAFATGRSPKTASVAVTQGLVDRLEPLELEGVIAHEMAHIGNRDILLNMMIITGLGVFGFLADMIFRVRAGDSSKNEKGAGYVLIIVGLALLVFNWLIAPIIQFAIFRTREYAADATGALITRNPTALAAALQKIQTDARVEALDDTPKMAAVCIYNPRQKEVAAFGGLGETHPPVQERIRRLQNMAGQEVTFKGAIPDTVRLK